MFMRKLIEEGKEEYARTKTTPDLRMWAAAFVLSLAQWHHVAFFFGNDTLWLNIQAEQGILDGYPHWRVIQSRVLGPWLEKFLSLLFGFKLCAAHIIIAVIVLTLCGVVMFHAGRAIGGRQRGWSALLAFHVLFTLMMALPWLYIWDYFVLLAAAVFMLLMIRRAPWWSFLLLMSVAFFNHESALFIGVWMVAKALADAWAERRRPDWGMLGGGVLGSLGGIVLMEYLRTSLLKRETGWEIFRDVGKPPTDPLEDYYYFHLQLPANLNDIYHWITHPTLNLLFVIPLPLVLALSSGRHPGRAPWHEGSAAGDLCGDAGRSVAAFRVSSQKRARFSNWCRFCVSAGCWRPNPIGIPPERYGAGRRDQTEAQPEIMKPQRD